MSKTIRLNWDGATDDKGITAYELMYALAPGFNVWQQAAIISTTQSTNVSYDFVTTNYVDHRFSIRAIDTIGQYSDYKYVTQTIAPVTTFISTNSSSTLGTCGNPTYTPSDIINIYSGASLIGNTDILSGNVVKTEGNLVFNGLGNNWNVLHYNKSYNCTISTSGVITSVSACAILYAKSFKVSVGKSNSTDACKETAFPTTWYCKETVLQVNTIVYSDPQCLQPVNPGNFFKEQVSNQSYEVQNITGKILSYGLCGITRRINYKFYKSGTPMGRAAYNIIVNGITVIDYTTFGTAQETANTSGFLDVQQGDVINFSLKGYNGSHFAITSKIQTDTVSNSKTQSAQAIATITFTIGVTDENVTGSVNIPY